MSPQCTSSHCLHSLAPSFLAQVDASWLPFLSRPRRRWPQAGGAMAAAAARQGGRRALRLGSSDTWVPFSALGGVITSGPGGDTLQASSECCFADHGLR